MKTYDIRCPICGRMNRDLLLDDSNGWMECEECGGLTLVSRRDRERGCVSFPTLPAVRSIGALRGLRR